MTQRLPIPGQDDGIWGDILNGFLEVSLNADGTLQTTALTTAGGEVTSNKGQASGYAALNSSGLVPTIQLATGTASSSNFLRGDGTWVVPNSGSSTLAADTDVSISSPANNQVLTFNGGLGKWENVAAVNGITINSGSTQTGIVNIPAVQLAGDVSGGTAATPQVTSTHLSSALPVNQGGTGTETLTGVVIGNGTSAMSTVTAPVGTIVGTSDTQTLTNKNLNSGTNTFPTLNQNTTGNAATATTASTVTTIPALTGDVTSNGSSNATTLASSTNVESIISANTTVTSKAPLASPALTGAPTAPTASALTNSTQLATTAYTDSAVGVETTRAEAAEALKAPLASPALTGTPTAPTASAGTTTTQIATTAFVALLTITSQTTNYTFALTDGGTEVDYNSSSAGTFTVPLNSSVAFPVGTIISCRQVGTGQLTIAGASGVTLNSANALVTRAQYSLISVTKSATNSWYVDGDT